MAAPDAAITHRQTVFGAARHFARGNAVEVAGSVGMVARRLAALIGVIAPCDGRGTTDEAGIGKPRCQRSVNHVGP